jgi:hypothetical protein
MSANTRAIQVAHDRHAANPHAAFGATRAQAAHKQRQAAKAALRADPEARAAALPRDPTPPPRHPSFAGPGHRRPREPRASGCHDPGGPVPRARTYPADGTLAHANRDQVAAVEVVA